MKLYRTSTLFRFSSAVKLAVQHALSFQERQSTYPSPSGEGLSLWKGPSMHFVTSSCLWQNTPRKPSRSENTRTSVARAILQNGFANEVEDFQSVSSCTSHDFEGQPLILGMDRRPWTVDFACFQEKTETC